MYIGWLYHPIYITELPMSTHITVDGKYTSATIFTDEVEASAMSQIYEMVNNPAFDAPIVIMPDVHAGKGSVIGFTMPYNGKIIPSVVGVDIGCGIHSYEFYSDDINVNIDLPKIDELIRSVVPVGFSRYHKPVNVESLLSLFYSQIKGLSSVVQHQEVINDVTFEYIDKLVNSTGSGGIYGCGSLGGGNHFIELGINKMYHIESDYQPLVLTIHSGSRQFGLKVCEKWEQYMADNNLPYLEGKSADGYLVDMCIAQQYAHMSRLLMLDNIVNALNRNHLDVSITDDNETVHNYISFDQEHVIIRKGAVAPEDGMKFQIPLNMADGIIIAYGVDNPEWNYSAPHGAGRLYSRAQAKKQLSLDEFKDRMSSASVYVSNMDKSLLDESPMAYKDSEVIKEIIGSVYPIHSINKPILNIKA